MYPEDELRHENEMDIYETPEEELYIEDEIYPPQHEEERTFTVAGGRVAPPTIEEELPEVEEYFPEEVEEVKPEAVAAEEFPTPPIVEIED